MLIFKNFIKKKTTLIFILILLFVFLLPAIFLSYKNNLFEQYDNDYKDTYFVFYTDKDIDNIIYNENNIIDIHKDNIDDDTYKYSYEFKLKHYYDFMNNIKYFKEKLYNNNVKFDEEINVNGVSSLDIGDTINIINIIVTCIIIVDIIVLVITLFNLVVDEENSNRLCKYLGYNSIQISITTIIKVLYVIIIPLVLSLLAYFILLRIY